MCCSNGVIPRSDPHFSILPTNHFLPYITTTWPNPFLRLSFPTTTHLPKPHVSLRTRVGSFTTKAAFNDGGSVASLPVMDTMSFYDLLGLSEIGSLVEIKQAYKQLARKYHPDVSPPDRVEEYTQRFIQVQKAYETLSDSSRRALYDSDMDRGLHLTFSARRRYHSDENLSNKDSAESRWRPGMQGQGSRGGRGNYPPRHTSNDACGGKNYAPGKGKCNQSSFREGSQTVLTNGLTAMVPGSTAVVHAAHLSVGSSANQSEEGSAVDISNLQGLPPLLHPVNVKENPSIDFGTGDIHGQFTSSSKMMLLRHCVCLKDSSLH